MMMVLSLLLTDKPERQCRVCSYNIKYMSISHCHIMTFPSPNNHVTIAYENIVDFDER